MRYIFGLSYFVIFIFNSSCQNNSTDANTTTVNTLIDSLIQIYAPDKRVARFDIQLGLGSEELILSGESDQIEAVDALFAMLAQKSIAYKDSVTRLPDESAKATPFAVVNNSVANLRSEPRHSAELATQATLGTSLKVLKVTKEWYLVQTPDDYISWVDHGGVILMSDEQFESWEQDDKLIITALNARVYGIDNSNTVISDVVLGGILVINDNQGQYFEIQFPDGRKGKIASSDARRYELWIAEMQSSGALIEAYARDMMGIPYLWGGTSVKGMDCSGFTKTVYYMNGLVIPRDASQQIEAGEVVDSNLSFDGLEIGDLLFFGKPATDSTRQRTTHVGIWLGGGEFIHASKRVRISSINPESEYYDEFNKNRYLGSRRYLNSTAGNILDLRSRLTSK